MTGPGRGRRRGGPDTRAQIVVAARERFAARGFAQTSMRGVAADAGVDPALVHHYFGSKQELVLAALELPADPRERLAGVVAAGADAAGEGMVRTLLGVWDDPDLGSRMLAAVRGMLEPGGEALFVRGFVPAVLLPVGEALGLDRPELRMSLVASQLVGLVMSRYVLGLEPLASLPPEAVVAAYAPTLQRYLTGPLEVDGTPPGS